MERISDNTCAGKWAQYGKFQFKDISAELTTIDLPADTDEFVRVDTSREKRMEDWKPAFTDAALERAPAMADVWKDCK